MIRVFISQPFSGKTEEDVMYQRDVILEKLKRHLVDEFTVIDQYHPKPPFEEDCCKNERLWYLGNSIRLMSTADVIVFACDWKEALGCKAEMEIAQLYNMNIMMSENL